MSRIAKLDFRTATAEQIVDAIRNKVTTYNALIGFRQRIGARKADRQYPQTRDALFILRSDKARAKRTKLIRETLKPFNAKLADGAEVLDLMQPVINDWKEYFFNHEDIGLMDNQVAVMALLLSADYLQQLKTQAV